MVSKSRLLGSAVALAMLGATAAQAEDFSSSANVMLATDYIFRGVSQTRERPAIQGGFDVGYGGLYGGVWASNVDFGSAGQTSTEIDWYGGYSGEIGCSSCSYKVGFIWYDYEHFSNDSELDYIEAAVSLSFSDFTVGVNYSPEYLGSTTTDAVGDEVELWYPYVNYGHTLPGDISFSAHVAYNLMSEKGVFEPDEDKYLEWSLGLSKDFGGLTFGVTYWDTDIGDLFGVDSNDADARVVFSVSKAL